MFNVLPAFPDISLEVWSVSDDGQTVSLRYVGCESDVVSAGVVGAEFIAKKHAKAKRPGGGRRDADGDRIEVQRWNLVRKGVVVPRIKLMFREKLLANARKLPGFTVAWALWQQQLAEVDAEERRTLAQRASRPAAQGPDFREFVETVQKLAPEDQRDVLRRMRFLANKSSGRFSVVVDNTRSNR